MKKFPVNKPEMWNKYQKFDVGLSVLCWKWQQICRSPTNQFEKSLFQIGSNLKKAFFKLVHGNGICFPDFSMRRAAEKYALFVGAEKSGKHFFANTLSFPGTKIFRKKMSAQLVPSLMYACYRFQFCQCQIFGCQCQTQSSIVSFNFRFFDSGITDIDSKLSLR